MPSNKPRLYVALHHRSAAPKMAHLEDTYHWSLLIGPKHETLNPPSLGYITHARDDILSDGSHRWEVEQLPTSMGIERMLLVRICIGKLIDLEATLEILRSVKLQEGWNCVYWLQAALKRLSHEKEGGKGLVGEKCKLEWEEIRKVAMEYAKRKKDQGRWRIGGGFDVRRPPTWDLVEGKEVVP